MGYADALLVTVYFEEIGGQKNIATVVRMILNMTTQQIVGTVNRDLIHSIVELYNQPSLHQHCLQRIQIRTSSLNIAKVDIISSLGWSPAQICGMFGIHSKAY